MNLDIEIAYREAIGQVLQTMTMKTGDIPRDHEIQPDDRKDYRAETDREIKDDLLPIQEQYLRDAQDPEYAKPTIAKKMKEKELVRIPDEKV